jgi:hypothetical protein
MTSKPTTFRDAGLSITPVTPDAGVGKNTVRALRRRPGLCYHSGDSWDNRSYRVKQESRLGLISGLPDAGMGAGMDHFALPALPAQHLAVKDDYLSWTIKATAFAAPLTRKLPCIIPMHEPRTVRPNSKRRCRHYNAA